MEWSPESAEKLARELMSPLGERWRHVSGVAARVHSLTEDTGCRVAAWLHDVGYADHLYRTGMHAIDGAMYLDSLGAPREVVSLVAFHSGAEFEAEERGLTDKLLLFDFPDRSQLDLLTLADLTTSPAGERVSVDVRVDDILVRYEPQHPVHRAVMRGRGTLEERCARVMAAV